MHDAVVGLRELRLREQIVEHRTVLDLRNADHGGEALVLGGDVEEHAVEVGEFPVVLGRVPLLGPLGRELLVVHARIMDRVEEVLEVVEDHLVGLLREACRDQRRKETGN